MVSRTTRITPATAATTNRLAMKAKYHSFIYLDGRRIEPSTKADRAPNSIIQMELMGTLFVGQVIGVLSHTQGQIGTGTFLQVHWFRSNPEIDTSAWDP